MRVFHELRIQNVRSNDPWFEGFLRQVVKRNMTILHKDDTHMYRWERERERSACVIVQTENCTDTARGSNRANSALTAFGTMVPFLISYPFYVLAKRCISFFNKRSQWFKTTTSSATCSVDLDHCLFWSVNWAVVELQPWVINFCGCQTFLRSIALQHILQTENFQQLGCVCEMISLSGSWY